VDEGEAGGHEPAPGQPGELDPAVDGDEGPEVPLGVVDHGPPRALRVEVLPEDGMDGG